MPRIFIAIALASGVSLLTACCWPRGAKPEPDAAVNVDQPAPPLPVPEPEKKEEVPTKPNPVEPKKVAPTIKLAGTTWVGALTDSSKQEHRLYWHFEPDGRVTNLEGNREWDTWELNGNTLLLRKAAYKDKHIVKRDALYEYYEWVMRTPLLHGIVVDGDTIKSKPPESPYVVKRVLPGGTSRKSSGGLVGHWRFDGADDAALARDASGRNNHGKINDGKSVPGIKGTALAFESKKGQYFDLGRTKDLDIEHGWDFTYIGWVKTKSHDGIILCQSNPAKKVSSGITISLDRGYVRVNIEHDLGHGHVLYGRQPVANDVWHQFALVRAGRTMRLFVDGELDAQLTIGPANNAITTIDRAVGSSRRDEFEREASRFKGAIDEVRIYHRALTSIEIKAMMDPNYDPPSRAKPQPEPLDALPDPTKRKPSNGLVAHWSFERCDDKFVVQDLSGRNNHGKIFMPQGVIGVKGFAFGYGGLATQYFDMGESKDFDFLEGWDFTYTGWFLALKNGPILAQTNSPGWRGGGQISILVSNYKLAASVDGDTEHKLLRMDGKTRVDDKRWHHFALVRAGKELQLYYDGQLVASSKTKAESITTRYRCIGANMTQLRSGYKDDRGTFAGGVDEVRIYQKALSAAEIAELMRNP